VWTRQYIRYGELSGRGFLSCTSSGPYYRVTMIKIADIAGKNVDNYLTLQARMWIIVYSFFNTAGKNVDNYVF